MKPMARHKSWLRVRWLALFSSGGGLLLHFPGCGASWADYNLDFWLGLAAASLFGSAPVPQ